MSGQEKNTRSMKPNLYVGIGASAGGLEAIEAFFSNMPNDSGLAFIVVQHLSPDYKSMMVELLSKKTRMKVVRTEHQLEVQANTVYLIPPKKNLTIFHGKLLLNEKDLDRGINLPIDIFLKSLAEDQGPRAVGIILSGTGSDGTRGVRAIKEYGGMVMIQDEQSSRFDGMPRAAAGTGLADFIMPPAKMPEQLLSFASHPCVTADSTVKPLLTDEDSLTRIFALLRERTKVDFTYYKPNTIIRRIERRMGVNQINELPGYVDFLQQNPDEQLALYREFLIGVTNFFRDDDLFNMLAEKWLPPLLSRVSNREMRIWVPGCSTGEEAYTYAMMIRECMEQEGMNRDIKIFATDIDRDAIVRAGAGLYPDSIMADLSPHYLSKYFYHQGEQYRVTRTLREMVIFAQQNLLRDPPFTNIDLVSCRNLLIYLQPILQKKIIELFNFSLNPGGLLVLGKSETLGDKAGYFDVLNQTYKIYRSKGKVARGKPIDPITPPEEKLNYPGQVAGPSVSIRQAIKEEQLTNRFLDVLAGRYVPLAIVVNESLEILHTIGDAADYFRMPSGPAVFTLSRMASKELSIPLITGIQKVFRRHEELVFSNVRVETRTDVKCVTLRVVPMPPPRRGQEALVAVFLEELEEVKPPEVSAQLDLTKESQDYIANLEQELQFSRENLQATIEELETSNEELQATNEELMASNEELQSTNEELQSTNEELHTINAEDQNRIMELTELTNDVDNLLSSSRIGQLLLDENLEIRRFSPEVKAVFRIMETDVGRPISHLVGRLADFDPEQAAARVQRTQEPIECVCAREDGHGFLTRVVPYQIGPNAFAGIVMTFVDITNVRAMEAQAKESSRIAEDLLHYMPVGIFIYRLEGERLLLEDGNPEAERITGVSVARKRGQAFSEIWPGVHDPELCPALLQTARREIPQYENPEIDYDDEHMRGSFRVRAFSLPGDRLAVSFEDITGRKKLQQDLKESERLYQQLFETMAQGVVYQAPDGQITRANPAAERILGLSLDQMQGRTSADPGWRAVDQDGKELQGDEHPSMVALRTGKPVNGFIMQVYNPVDGHHRVISVNATPIFKKGKKKPVEVYATFEDITELMHARQATEKSRGDQ
ncbi:MAG: PAS domain S-box protein [Spartobacteria bacterium]|nr:PAS domain S-box protein [Spartobacteria bacterium]